MANEQIQSILASNRDAPDAPPGAKQDCSDIVNISIYFDGTGNNKDVDEKPQKWANPARMWFAATQLKDKNSYPIYVSGVGTPFNGKATGWLDDIWKAGEDKLTGSGFGAGGTRRTEYGQNNVNDTLRRVLLSNAKKLDATTKAYAEKGQNQSFADVSKALAGHRLIKMINLSIFGFSRGAALGRAFCNDFLKDCKTDKDGQLTYQGYPLRIHFMGLFDTVASFGVPAGNMDGLFTEKNLKVPGQVERCVHYVAAHELRFSFPSDLIRQHGKLMSNWTETIYPGVHSDVGGGYEPVDQDRPNNYARIPLRDMMSEAVKVGVRIMSYGDLEKAEKLKFLFSHRFKIDPETEKAYKDYMGAVSPSGTAEQAVATHMKALYSAYGTLARKGIKTPDHATDIGHTLVGHASMEREVKALRSRMSTTRLLLDQASIPQTLQFFGTVYGQTVTVEPWRLHAWDSTASDAVLGLVKGYIHDSKSGFMYGVEPFSYFRPRGMTESSINVLAKGVQWLDQNVEAAKNGVIKIYNSAEGVVVETYQAGKLIATQTYKVGEKFTVDTVQAGEKYAVEVYNTSKQVVISTVDAGQKMIVSSINTVQKKANELADATQKKATEVGQEIQQGATKLSNEAGQAYDTAKKNVSDMATQVNQGAKQVSDAGMKIVEDGWKSTKSLLGF